MSAYPAATYIPLLSSPVRQALDSLQALIMQGLPALGLTTPTWTDPALGAPADHYFLPTGCRLYRSDLPDDVRGHALILHQEKEATRLIADDPRLWSVPLQIRLLYTRTLTTAQTDTLLRWLEQFFTLGFVSPTTGQRHYARHYLTTASLHVHTITAVTAAPYAQVDGWQTALSLSLTLHCSGIAPA